MTEPPSLEGAPIPETSTSFLGKVASWFRAHPAIGGAVGAVLVIGLIGGGVVGAIALQGDDEANVTGDSEVIHDEPSDYPGVDGLAHTDAVEEDQDPFSPVHTKVRIGKSVTVGQWKILITHALADANVATSEISSDNRPPKGRYVLIEGSGTYLGDSDPTYRTQVIGNGVKCEFHATDGIVYTSLTNTVSVYTQPIIDNWPDEVSKGGTAKFQEILDVPVSAIDGGQFECRISTDSEGPDDHEQWIDIVPAAGGAGG
jgi:hypothetical protein